MSLASDIAETTTIEAFSQGVTMLWVVHNGLDRPLSSAELGIVFRCFYWYAHEPELSDLRDAALAVMPVVGGYAQRMHDKGETDASYPLRDVLRAAEILAEYLDAASLTLRGDEDGAAIVVAAAYAMEDEVKKAGKKLLSSPPHVVKAERRLQALAKTRPGLKKLLALSPAKRVERLKVVFRCVTIAKNDAYNFVRTSGSGSLALIERTLKKLHPADQDFLLHGLDAFPKNRAVLALYRRFLAKKRTPTLTENVKKYADRVRRGVRTTGWER
ncbi:MAG: hypothetical protein IT381_29080 [Deltaproteobacteria bacterium]|nr:hypothetical protein [Deltaproteobacteria bacterium]